MKTITANPVLAIIGITIPEGARAVMVYEGDKGELLANPIARNKSVLNIETELLDHLNSSPYSDEWLLMLRDYCDQRVTARNAAKACGGFIMPTNKFAWTMTAVQS